MQAKSESGRLFNLPSDIQDAAIRTGLAADTDTREVSVQEIQRIRGPGRPLGSGAKTQITLRIDTDVLEKFKASGEGWQTRINDVLRANA